MRFLPICKPPSVTLDPNRTLGGGLTPALFWTQMHVRAGGVTANGEQKARENDSGRVNNRGQRFNPSLRWE